jgi:hypothetical protein
MNKRQKVLAYLDIVAMIQAKEVAREELVKPINDQIEKLKNDLEQAKAEIINDGALMEIMGSNDFGKAIMLYGDDLLIQPQQHPNSIHINELDEEL